MEFDYEKLDPENLKKDINQIPQLAEQGYRASESLDISSLKHSNNTIVVAGMGGSSIASQLLKSYLEDEKIKLHMVNDYVLPKWIERGQLVIVSSYSGNTEEALNVFKEARRAECTILVVTAGGKLEEYARVSRLPILRVPTGHQPRAIMVFQFFALLKLFERLKLIESKSRDVNRLESDLRNQQAVLDKNAIALSERMVGRIPVIYTSARFRPISYRWKCQFNENPKCMAFSNVFPEMNHNELAGMDNLVGSYHAIILRFEEDHRRIQQRMNLTKEIMLKKGIPVTDIAIRGPSLLSKMFSAIMLGDLTSYYLALRLKTNPSRVAVIEEFKKDMGPFVG